MPANDLYSALIGAPIDSAEKQAAIADLLRRKSGFANVAQLTGDAVLAPMGQQQAQQAGQQAQQLQRGAFQQQDAQQAQQRMLQQAQQAQQQSEFQRQQEARMAAAQKEQLALTRRGQDLDYDASMAGLESKAELAAAKAAAAGEKQPTEGERKNATLATRLEGALRELGSVGVVDAQKPGVLEKSLSAAGMEPLANLARSGDRQRADAAQLDALDAALTLGTGASYTKEQLEGQRKAYFPQINDTPEVIKAKQARLETLVKSARAAAGRAAPNIDASLKDPDKPPGERVIKRTGRLNGRKVVEYADGTVDYAD